MRPIIVTNADMVAFLTRVEGRCQIELGTTRAVAELVDPDGVDAIVDDELAYMFARLA